MLRGLRDRYEAHHKVHFSDQALIAAAIARAQAQKEGVQPKNIDNLTPEKQAEIREIESRRAQVREMAKTPPEEPV